MIATIHVVHEMELIPDIFQEVNKCKQKNHLLVNDVGMAKHTLKSTETRDEPSTTSNPKGMSRCLSTPDATSLYITASRAIVTIVLSLGIGH